MEKNNKLSENLALYRKKKKKPLCFIFIAPSGSGKTTVVKHLLENYPDFFGTSVSVTNRKKRDEEINGKDYFFKDMLSIEKMIKNHEFYECEEVYEGCFYGTPKSSVQKLFDEGKHILFDIDYKGAQNLSLNKDLRDNTIVFYIDAIPEDEVSPRNFLSQRITSRESILMKDLEKRLDKVETEIFEGKILASKIFKNIDLEKFLLEVEEYICMELESRVTFVMNQ